MITESEVRVWADYEQTTQVGQTIVTVSGDTAILIDDGTLAQADAILPGAHYWADCRVKNNLNEWSEWSEMRDFYTYPSFDAIITPARLPYVTANMVTSGLTAARWGVMITTDQNGGSAAAYSWSEPLGDGDTSQQYIYGLDENTEYYYVYFFYDSIGRYYQLPWDSAYSFTTMYAEADFSVTGLSTTSDSITVNVERETSDPNPGITYIYFRAQNKSVKLSEGVKGSGTYTVTNGDACIGGGTISIQPDTEYELTVGFYTSDDLETTRLTVRTDYEPYVSMSLAVSNITATTAILEWLVTGNTSELPTVSVEIAGGGTVIRPQTENDYGQWSVHLTGLSPATTYYVVGEAECQSIATPGDDSISFTTL